MGEKTVLGGKIEEKNCPRGINWREKLKLDKTVRGSQEKNMSEGVKNPVFVSKGDKENTRFCPGG